MLAIRQDQLDALARSVRRQSRDRILDRLNALVPDDVKAFGYGKMVRLCDRAIEKADSYDMGSEQGVLAYCAAMLFFGEDFDTNPNLVWTRDVLPVANMDGALKWRLLTLRIKMDTGRLVY